MNISDSQKRSLYAWLQATKKIGRGRSKFADKYRDIAQRNGSLQGCCASMDNATK